MITAHEPPVMSHSALRPGFYWPPPGFSVRPPDLAVPNRRYAPGHVALDRCHKPDRSPRGFVELSRLTLAALLLTYVIKTFLAQAFYIPSESMVPTLVPRDRVLIEKVTYRFRAPTRGDVIVFQRPDSAEAAWDRSVLGAARWALAGLGFVQPEGEVDYIKRIIGLPGDTVEVIGGTVFVNGQPLSEPYAEPETRDSPRVTVPPDRYFMMGDNRMNSLDSRFGLGLVPRDRIIGHAFAILWPPRSVTFSFDQRYPGLDAD
ncbi:MAG: signal peptidase I [Egibacteraceae bacterium]